MTAEAVPLAHPLAHPVTPPAGVETLAAVARGAVDRYEVAARLESSGTSDRVAARHGRADVFELAATVFRPVAEPAGRRRSALAGDLRPAVLRAGLLLAGVVLLAEVLAVVHVAERTVFVAGALGWAGGQVVAAIAWTRLGAGQGPAGLRSGGTAALLVVAVAAAGVPWGAAPAGVLTGTALAGAWTAYAGAVSLLVCARRTGGALAAVAGGALVGGGALVWSGEGHGAVVLGAAGAAGLAVVVMAAVAVVRAGGLSVPSVRDRRAAAPAGLQAVLLAGSLLALLHTLPEDATLPVVVAGVLGAAVADPIIAVLRAGLRASAARTYTTSAAAWQARRAAVVAAAGATATAALAAAVVLLLRHDPAVPWTATLLTAAAFTALSTTSSALTAFGVPWLAVGAAALAACYAAVSTTSVIVGMVVFPVGLVLALWLLLARLSDPRTVA